MHIKFKDKQNWSMVKKFKKYFPLEGSANWEGTQGAFQGAGHVLNLKLGREYTKVEIHWL